MFYGGLGLKNQELLKRLLSGAATQDARMSKSAAGHQLKGQQRSPEALTPQDRLGIKRGAAPPPVFRST